MTAYRSGLGSAAETVAAGLSFRAGTEPQDRWGWRQATNLDEFADAEPI